MAMLKLQEDVKFFNLYDPKTNEKKNPLRLKPNILPHHFDGKSDFTILCTEQHVAEDKLESANNKNADNEDIGSNVQHLLIDNNFKKTGTRSKRKDDSAVNNVTSSCDCKKSRHSRHLTEWPSPGLLEPSPSISTPSKSTSDAEFTPGASSQSSSDPSCEILDCFEIQIQKPSNAMHQAFSWSDYKQGNTVKYLISVQPCGHICYISEGYAGRVSDMQVTRSCGYLDILEKGTVALADRGFKHLEAEFADRGCMLLRPPSVSADAKLSEEESMVTKHIAALRIHVERVIGRLREFACLAPHACIDPSMLGLQDEAKINCGKVCAETKLRSRGSEVALEILEFVDVSLAFTLWSKQF
ncbi:hypothetical protein B566_EDAN011121 [Ephemera danica]|nr:hypothetical protein B566_EDAN011121 [Ephemera danica]